jgi:hypothetical protein
MSTINRQDIISDDALTAPLILAENMQKVVEVMKKIADNGRKASKDIETAETTQKVRVAVDGLTAEQKELQKITAQVAAATAKNNAQYVAQEKALKAVREQIKQKTALGDKDAKSITKQNASLTQLEAALKANRAAYADLRTEEERASESGQELLNVIQEQAAGVAELRENLVQFNHNVGNYTGSIIKAKQELDRLEKETLALVKAQKKEKQETDESKRAFNQYNKQIQNNITQINIYRNAVAKASLEQKKLSSGSGGGGFGDAADALGDLNPALGEGIGKIQQFSGAMKKLMASPFGPYLLALGVAVGAIGAYFTGSIEGQDRFGRKMTWLTSYTVTFRMEAEKLGKYLVDMWDNPTQAIGDYVKLGLQNVFNRLTAVLTLAKAVPQAFGGEWKKAAKTAADAFVQFYTGITNATQKLADFQSRASADQAKRDLIEIRNQKFKKDAIQDIIDDSITELEVAKLLAKVKDDLRYADEDRLVALREANDLLEEQAAGDIELAKEELAIAVALAELEQEAFARANQAEMTAEEIAKHRQTTYEEEQKIAELTAKVNKTEEEFFLKKKKRDSEEFATVKAINDRRLAAIKAEEEAYDKLATFRLEDNIKLNQKIVDEEESSYEARYIALTAIAKDQITLALEAAEGEKAAALEASKQRVNLSTEERKAIFENKSLSIDEQLALQEEYLTKHAVLDQAYLDEATRIEEAKFAEIVRINEESSKLVRENAFKVIARDADKWADESATDAAIAMKKVVDEYLKGNISLEEYYKQRKDIQEMADENSLSLQLANVNEQLEIAKVGSVQYLDLLRQQAELELALQDETAKKKEEREIEYNEAMSELRQEAADSTLSIIDNLFEAEDMRRDERLARLQEKYDQELLMAGDNDVAKAELENKFLLQQAKIRKEQAAADRKRAMFEKATAAVQIAINTAVAISKAARDYGFPLAIPFIAIAAATGAVQLAAVLSKPIPSYAKGTDNHPGGPARFGEKGAELVTLPTGESFVAEKETIADLPAGTQVKNHQDTMRALAMEGLKMQHTGGRQQGYGKEFEGLRKEFQDFHHTLKHKKAVHFNFSRRGAEAILAGAATNSKILDTFYR